MVSHYFKSEENLDYIGPIPDIWYYGANEIERGGKFLLYENHKSEPFDNRRVLETYCQNDVTVLRQASRVFE